MAPPNHRLHSPLVRGVAGGASKVTVALAKIIAVISTVPPSLDTTLKSKASAFINDDGGSKATDINLNISLGLEFEGAENGGHNHNSFAIDPVITASSVSLSNLLTVDDESISSTESVAGDDRTAGTSAKGESDPEGEEDKSKNKEEDVSEITNVQYNGSSEGYLDLLIEAVQHELEPVEAMPTKEQSEGLGGVNRNKRVPSPSKRSRETMMSWAPFDFSEESAPVVRSKRGRNQMLPSRYRDSVIEPWAKPPTVSRHGNGRTSRP